MQRLLNAESERLTLAREEICQITMGKGTEVMQLKAQVRSFALRRHLLALS